MPAVNELPDELGLNVLMAPMAAGRTILNVGGQQGSYRRLETGIITTIRATVEASVRQFTLGSLQALDCVVQVIPDRLPVCHMQSLSSRPAVDGTDLRGVAGRATISGKRASAGGPSTMLGGPIWRLR